MAIDRPIKFGTGEGEIPYEEPINVVAVQVPMVYDECKQEHCVRDTNLINYLEGLDTTSLEYEDQEVHNHLLLPNRYLTFDITPTRIITTELDNLKVTSIQYLPCPETNFNCVKINYDLEYTSYVLFDYTDPTGPRTVLGVIPQSLTNLTKTVKLYCPKKGVQGSTRNGDTSVLHQPTIKVLIDNFSVNLDPASIPANVDVSGAGYNWPTITWPADFSFVNAPNAHPAIYFLTPCYQLIIKSEYDVQLLVPTYGTYVGKKQCEHCTDEDPCEDFFENPPTPTPYPDLDFDNFDPD
ncbi:hypothetical protein ACFIJ5_04615 [Haloimpatiens sp. FM7330]|uniref:hypothetical protein n=1 Tax=Haloimpatiens sp. FM7330 TaxID=3298610 RepID=UPI00364349AF